MENRCHRKPVASDHSFSRGGDWFSVLTLVDNKSTPSTLVEQYFRRRLAVSTLCTIECGVADRIAVISLPVRANIAIKRPGMGLDLRVFNLRDLLRDLRVVDSEGEKGFGECD